MFGAYDIQRNFDTLMHAVCVGYGFCGSIQDDKPVHVTDYLPECGQVSADQFVEWLFLAEGLRQDLAPLRHRRALRGLFVEHMGAEAVDASLLQWAD